MRGCVCLHMQTPASSPDRLDPNGEADVAAAVFAALADPTRVRIVALLLARGELCICHIEEALGISQPRASRQVRALREAGLVVTHRRGQWVHCRVAADLDGLRGAAVEGVRASGVPDEAGGGPGDASGVCADG